MKPEDNERLTRVGPGTPGGDLFRRYWQPALLSKEAPTPDGAPVRVRLLGEDLIAFRDSAGKVGLVEAYCPHRRAPLYFARNEECGLRCVYHGWKFNRDGDCVDMPSEPPGTPLQAKVKLLAYPTHEAGGIVWTYMGPKELMPAPPDYEWLRTPATHLHVSKTYEDCNYLQGLEGGLDTAHVSFLHRDDRNAVTHLSALDTAPKLDVSPTDYGYYYVSQRNIGPERKYVRIYQYIMPAQQMRPSVVASSGGKQEMPTIDGHIWAPIDDERTNVYNYIYSFSPEHPLSADFIREEEEFFGRGENDFIPGTFRLKQNAGNDYLVDRSLQQKGNFSGIVGINTQDFALQEGMGKIVDRSREFLGTTDRAIVVMRRMMLEAMRTVESGGRPPGIEPGQHRGARAHDDIVSPTSPLQDLLDEARARW
jgi:phthalate 4,5-dioxygenase oxygenase subunit